jgi:hypothetical protein
MSAESLISRDCAFSTTYPHFRFALFRERSSARRPHPKSVDFRLAVEGRRQISALITLEDDTHISVFVNYRA